MTINIVTSFITHMHRFTLRPWRKRIIVLIVIIALLFIIKSSYFVDNKNKPQLYIAEVLGFSQIELLQAKQLEIELKHKYDLTAVLLHWRRTNSLITTVDFLVNSNVFKEIIIWNNNPNVTLTKALFSKTNYSFTSIRIVSSVKNLKDEAKYRACSLAKTTACFYVDDDWDVSFYLKSLIADFRSDPSILHAVTNSYTFYTNLLWSYFDTTIDLHSGFSWIGCGSIFLRDYAQRHLEYLKHFLVNNNTDLTQLGDVFFSIWLNDVPSQINLQIRNLPGSGGAAFSSAQDFYEFQRKSSVLAIRILEENLRNRRLTNTKNIQFSHRTNRRFPYYVKSTNLKDEFIFYTNILPVDMESIPFNISRDFERATRKNLPEGQKVTFFRAHTTMKAVDDNKMTCWCSHRKTRQGDFFAIDLLSIRTNVSFTLTIQDESQFERALDLQLSLDGLKWITHSRRTIPVSKTQNLTNQHKQHTVLVDSSQFSVGFQSFRYICFNATKDGSLDKLRVCDVQLLRSSVVPM